jgi:protein SCO1/2
VTAALFERAPAYAGLSVVEADMMRAAAMLRAGPSALPYIVEELELGDSAICAAGAARAAGQGVPPAALLVCVERWLFSDRMVELNGQRVGLLAELFAAFGRVSLDADTRGRLEEIAAMTMRPFDDATANVLREVLAMPTRRDGPCCAPPACSTAQDRAGHEISDIPLHDALGQTAPFHQVFAAPLNVIAFFYTRCMNPQKCALTVQKMGMLAARSPQGVTCAVITYDPAFDTPAVLARYARSRGLPADSPLRLLRAPEGMADLIDHFDLGVGYGETTVNRHRIEVFLTDSRGRILESILRRNWTVEDVSGLVARQSR